MQGRLHLCDLWPCESGASSVTWFPQVKQLENWAPSITLSFTELILPPCQPVPMVSKDTVEFYEYDQNSYLTLILLNTHHSLNHFIFFAQFRLNATFNPFPSVQHSSGSIRLSCISFFVFYRIIGRSFVINVLQLVVAFATADGG